MKNLREYIAENYLSNDDAELLFEGLDENLTLSECLERIGDAMIADALVQEGIFSKIGAKLASWGKKAEKAGNAADEKIEKLSSDTKKAVQNAIDSTKERAGEAWDKMKGTYKNVVAAVGTGVDAAKNAVAGIAKATGEKAEELVAKVSTVITNGIAQGKESLSKAIETPVKMAAVTMLIGALAACNKSDVNVGDVLAAAGIKLS